MLLIAKLNTNLIPIDCQTRHIEHICFIILNTLLKRAIPRAKQLPRMGEAWVSLKKAQKKYNEAQKAAGKKQAYKRRTGSALTRQKESQKKFKKRLRLEKKQQQQQQEQGQQPLELETVKRPSNRKVYSRKLK